MSAVIPTRPVADSVPATAASPALLIAPPEIEHLFQVSLFLLIVTGFGTLAATGKLDLFSLAFVLAALLLRAVLLLRDKPLVIPRRVISWLSVGYLPFFFVDFFFFSGRDWVTPAVHLVLFIICIMLFNVERERDYILLAVLSFLMVLSATIFTVDSAFLAAFGLFVILAVFWFMTFELRRSAIAATNTAPLVIPGLLKRRRAISPLHRLAASLARTTVLMVAGILAAASLLFFAMPRISGGYLSRHAQSDAISTGFSDTVNLGEIGHIQQSSEVVAHIRIDGDTTGDRLIRLRGSVLTNFDGKRWTNPRREAGILSQGGRVFQLTPRGSRSDPREDLHLARGPQFSRLQYHVLMEPLSTSVIFTIPAAQALFGPFREVAIDDDLSFHNLEHDRTITLYEGVSDVSVPLPTTLARLPDTPIPVAAANNVPAAVSEPSAPAPATDNADAVAHIRPPLAKLGNASAAGAASIAAYPRAPAARAPFPEPVTAASSVLERYLQLPDKLDPRIPDLARQLTASEPNPYLRALAIERYLSTRYGYTLQLPSQSPDDPIADFLFSRRRGHCEYFASSMTVLLRTIGIPSRIINGFRGAQFNQLNATYIVRASDAHSWVEAYIPGAGWVTFDPTPAGNTAPANLWTRYQLYLDAAREFWREWIVNYDAGHQQALSVAAIRQSRNRVADFRAWSARLYHRMLQQARRFHRAATHNPRRLIRPSMRLLAVLLLIALPFAARRFHLRWRASSPQLSPRSAASILYARMARRLARRGYPRAPAQTPIEFAASIDDPALREAVLRFTSAYQSARFGGASAEDLPALLDQVRNTPART